MKVQKGDFVTNLCIGWGKGPEVPGQER